MACTTILVGKNASYDGSTLVARNEDSPAGEFTPKEFIVVSPEEHPIKYKSVISKVEIKLPEHPMRYTLLPDAKRDKGIWGACGVNEKNVSMSATETITSNERVLSGDPLVEGGIGEEDMVSLVLPYMTSARDGVLRLGGLLEEFGTYEMNGIAFQDRDEIWWLETVGGHHWIAAKLPDDCYAVIPNQLGIDYFDLEDAFGEQKEFMCSKDMKEFIKNNHLELSIDEEYLNARDAFGSHSDSDHTYNTPRAWVLQRHFNQYSNLWDGMDADFKPDSNDIPWCRTPDKKITVEDIKWALSNHFQGTPYDPYSKHSNPLLKGMFRPIGVNRTNVMALVQIRPYMPEAMMSLKWIAYGSNVFNAQVPFYTQISKTPAYMKTGDKVNSAEFYWANRLIGALSNAAFANASGFIERYQMKLQSSALAIIKKYDAKVKAKKMDYSKVEALLEQANEEIAKLAQEETDKLLADVLHQASMEMKNGFARSDA